MSAITQSKRLISLNTPLGIDKLILTSFQGEETLSQLFCYQLEAFSDNSTITAEDLIGKQISWQINKQTNLHYFNGYVGEFFAGAVDMRGYRTYRLMVYPWLWFLTHTCNCRIFQQQNLSEIVTTIFKEYGFSDYKFQLQKTDKKRDYCVQYNESDFAFISRLLEEEGIYYYFSHQQNKHELILADHNGAFKTCATNELVYATGSVLTKPCVYQWDHHYQFGTGGWSHTDYVFTTPGAQLFTSTDNKFSYANSSRYRVYEYPGNYQDKESGTAKAKLQIESIEANQTRIAAASNCPGLLSGGKFKLTHHECQAEQGEYVITTITHQAEDNSHLANNSTPAAYQNLFTCIPYDLTFRPQRKTAKPRVQGAQTALVVGPNNEEIYTDEHGRIKVQFFWDQKGEKNEKSSCWVRVGQLWAGKQLGALFIPRVGQEVIVNFLEGDPDRPLVVGCVYNGEQKPIYDLPDRKWQSGIKTHSEQGANELRFDDQNDKEQIYLHAQKDLLCEVENNNNLTVKGEQTIIVTKNATKTISEGNDVLTVKKGNQTTTIETGNASLTISKGSHTTKVNLGSSSTEAMQAIELKVGQNSIKIDNTGITLNGMMIKINGQTMIELQANAMLTLKGGIVMIN